MFGWIAIFVIMIIGTVIICYVYRKPKDFSFGAIILSIYWMLFIIAVVGYFWSDFE